MEGRRNKGDLAVRGAMGRPSVDRMGTGGGARTAAVDTTGAPPAGAYRAPILRK